MLKYLLEVHGEMRQDVGEDDDTIPTTDIERKKVAEGIPAFKLFETSSLCASASEARRLIEQGGAYISNKKSIGLMLPLILKISIKTGRCYCGREKRNFIV